MVALPTEFVSEVDLHVKLWSYLSAVGVAVTLKLQQGGRETMNEVDRHLGWLNCLSAASVAVAVLFRFWQGGTQTMNEVDRYTGRLGRPCVVTETVAVSVDVIFKL